MPHALTELNLAEVTKPAAEPAHEIRADVCVVGAGIAGLSAAIESAGCTTTWCWSPRCRLSAGRWCIR